ncbi:MAG: DUF507 family protein [Campylobacterales bacterium]|nr:DUF507 family protein [Campylobacterales bacterium]
MRIKENQARFVADRIAREMLNSGVVKFKEGMDPLVTIAEEHLLDDIKWEKDIDVEADGLMEDYQDEIEFQRVDRRQLFWMIKRKICDEDGFNLDKDERYSSISHDILNEYLKKNLVTYNVSDTRVKNIIVKAIFDFGKFQDQVDSKVREKIASYKRDIKKGTEEYEILTEKFYEEEMNRLGM